MTLLAPCRRQTNSRPPISLRSSGARWFRLAVLLVPGALATACDEPPAKHSAMPGANDGALLRQLSEVARPCVDRARDPKNFSLYRVHVALTRSIDNHARIAILDGDRADFNACVVQAVEAAHLPPPSEEKQVLPVAFPL